MLAYPLASVSTKLPALITSNLPSKGCGVNGVTVGSSNPGLVGSVESEVSVTVFPNGSVPVTVAVFSTLPAVISAAVNTYEHVNVVVSVAPTAIVAIGPPNTVHLESVILTLVNARAPEFLTVNVYLRVSPTCAAPSLLVSTKVDALINSSLHMGT
jgi:hypothetical protein